MHVEFLVIESFYHHLSSLLRYRRVLSIPTIVVTTKGLHVIMIVTRVCLPKHVRKLLSKDAVLLQMTGEKLEDPHSTSDSMVYVGTFSCQPRSPLSSREQAPALGFLDLSSRYF